MSIALNYNFKQINTEQTDFIKHQINYRKEFKELILKISRTIKCS